MPSEIIEYKERERGIQPIIDSGFDILEWDRQTTERIRVSRRGDQEEY